MSTSPERPGGAPSSTFTTPKKVPLKGLFAGGIWHCNCHPRLPAASFQVRKEGPNTGRWFYTCQELKDASCGFFLWADDAVSREMRAVINNSRSEPEISNKEIIDPGNDRRTVQGHIEASNKWIADLGRPKEEDFGDWPLSTDAEERIVAPLLPSAFLKTPRKAIEKDVFTTPGSKRKREAEMLPTPATGDVLADDVFTSPSTVRPRGRMWDGNERFGLRSPSKTPTPNTRFREGTDPIHDSRTEGPSQTYDITDDVFQILRDTQLDTETRDELKQLLRKHALRTSGIAKGRDISRMALRQKDERIAELGERVVRLEAERELDRTVIRDLKGVGVDGVPETGRWKNWARRGQGNWGGNGRGS